MACIGAGVVPDSIVILDISQPTNAKVVRTLWNRGAASDVYVRWPLISPSSGDLFFIGDERHIRCPLLPLADPRRPRPSLLAPRSEAEAGWPQLFSRRPVSALRLRLAGQREGKGCRGIGRIPSASPP